ncbi:MAG: YbaN family protein [Candidatus Izemoplasmatales bacterium]|nr:YbaN family protein [Candidatus Izemoplasmatales bacterium]
MKKTARFFLLPIGLLFFILGTVGIFLPILPTTPFYLLSIYFVSRSSNKVTQWIQSRHFYKTHVRAFQENKTMTISHKIKLIVSLTFVFGLAFYFSNHLHLRIILTAIWFVHVIYFTIFVKNPKKLRCNCAKQEDI